MLSIADAPTLAPGLFIFEPSEEEVMIFGKKKNSEAQQDTQRHPPRKPDGKAAEDKQHAPANRSDADMEGNDFYKRTSINGSLYYGKHLMITAVRCNENILEVDEIARFIKELVPKIDMTAHGDVVAARFGEGQEVGISAVQLIITSSITIHTNDMARDMYLDVFSCKWFDDDTVVRFVKEHFAPEDIKEAVMLRR